MNSACILFEMNVKAIVCVSIRFSDYSLNGFGNINCKSTASRQGINSTYLSHINIEDILKEYFSFSEGSNFDSDQETTELLLVLEPILIGMSKFKSQ
jgi:hypothetical protein